MYTCMSTAKATIKTVALRYNGTTDDLTSLEVLSIQDKTYPNEDSKPLWGVENTSMKLKDGGPLWGLVTPSAAQAMNLTALRKESLYLPGRDASINFQNLPATDFANVALDMVYKTGSSSQGIVDYSGQSNLAMFRRWQELSRTPETSAKILNLIWTDIAANMVVGTKGLEANEVSKRAAAHQERRKRDGASNAPPQHNKMPPITNYTRRVRYKYAYGIPAFIALALAAALFASTLFFALCSGAKPNTIRTILQHTSAGRFLTSTSQSQSHSHPAFSPTSTTAYAVHPSSPREVIYSNAPTHVWASGAGRKKFTLSAEGWSRNVQPVPPGYEEKSGAEVSYAPVPNPGAY